MTTQVGMWGGADRRANALLGLAGAVLSGIGDVLILGRSGSGDDFERAAGQIPPHLETDLRWQSLWNGATFGPRRIQLGTVAGLVGIGLLQWVSLRRLARGVHPGPLRTVATTAATAFAVSGCLTHLCCGRVILDYQRAAATVPEPTEGPRRSPRSVTTLLAASAVGALGALAAFSGSVSISALRRDHPAPALVALVTPFPCVLSTLMTFGAVPVPIGGFVRPASMSIGLMVYFAVTAAWAHADSAVRHEVLGGRSD